MVKVTVNGKEITAPDGVTVLQACELAGAEIPRFCYHDRLSIAGNCRMCLVDIERMPKPVASCAMPTSEGMIIHTDNARVKKAREGVMEFLLINHPLDCPICDQGGECDLQDQAMAYGKGFSRYHEEKRAVKDKPMGPLIKTHMTRCIHCTRCVRFATEIAGVPELGSFGRGEHMEIGTYVEKAVTSELSGNMIDLCPVGALTSKPYAFQARQWELKKTETIDVLDAVGCNIRVDSRGLEVMRILPRLNEAINEEWISDKTRFVYDALKVQRIDRAYSRGARGLEAAPFENTLASVAARLRDTPASRIGIVLGGMIDLETTWLAKQLCDHLGIIHRDCRPAGWTLPLTDPLHYRFNTTIAGIENSDLILLVGANPRHEATLVNARIRKRTRQAVTQVASIGAIPDQTYPVEYLGSDPSLLADIVAGNHPFAQAIAQAKHPMVIVGETALTRPDAGAIMALVHRLPECGAFITSEWNGMNLLVQEASRLGALDTGFVPGPGGKDTEALWNAAHHGDIDLLLSIGADDARAEGARADIIYLGHHGDITANHASHILPIAAYTESDGIFVNLEGTVQSTRQAVDPRGDARPAWQVIQRLLQAVTGSPESMDVTAIRAHIHQTHPWLAVGNARLQGPFIPLRPSSLRPNSTPLTVDMPHYYQNNALTRASKTLAACAQIYGPIPMIGVHDHVE